MKASPRILAMAKKTKIKIFNVSGERDILKIIDSPKSWSVDGSTLRTTFQKNETAPTVTVVTSLPFYVEEVNESTTEAKEKGQSKAPFKPQVWA